MEGKGRDLNYDIIQRFAWRDWEWRRVITEQLLSDKIWIRNPPYNNQEFYPLVAKAQCYVCRICYSQRQRTTHVLLVVQSHRCLTRIAQLWVTLNFEQISLFCFTMKFIQRCKILIPSLLTPDEARSRDVTMILVKFWAGLSCRR